MSATLNGRPPKVPVGTALTVEKMAVERLPATDIVWFRVVHKGKTGWVSEFTTNLTGDPPFWRDIQKRVPQ